MSFFLWSKLVSIALTLLAVMTLTFCLMKLVPGDPFSDEKGLPLEIRESLKKIYGLDKSWPKQYLSYLKSVITWNLGPSFKYHDRTVNQIINETFPISATLGAGALILAIAAGILIGVLSSIHYRNWQDHSLMILTTMGISVPSFIVAALLQYTLALKLGLFPIARWGSWMQAILPIFALAAMPMAYIARLIRSNLLEVFQQDYIKTAKSKGLTKVSIIRYHCLKNALLPLLPYFGQLTANILVGSFVIEKIFGIPGLGQWFISSIYNRDYPVIMGTTVFYSLILLSTLFLSDLLYQMLDPRAKEEGP